MSYENRISVITRMKVTDPNATKFEDNHTETIGYFFNFEKAEKAVLENSEYISDCYTSNYIVIEECIEGIETFENIEHWYRLNEDKKFEVCEKPKYFQGCLAFCF